MRKYIHIPQSQKDKLFIMAEYAFQMNPQFPPEPELPYGLLRGVEVADELVAGAWAYGSNC